AERCVRLAQACSRPAVAHYLMTLAANYRELAEQTGGVRRSSAHVISLDERRKRRGRGVVLGHEQRPATDGARCWPRFGRGVRRISRRSLLTQGASAAGAPLAYGESGMCPK